MTRAWNGVWLTVAFLAELAALAALAYGGWRIPGPTGLRVVLAVAAPTGAAVLWGLFAAPRAPRRSPGPALAVKVLVFGSAVLVLALTGHGWLALALAAGAMLSELLSTAPEPGPRPVRRPGD